MTRFADSYLGRLRSKIGTALVVSPAVRAVIEDSQGRVLLHLRPDFKVWGLPGGHPEDGESSSQCIRREAREETGLELGRLEAFGFSSVPSLELCVYPHGDQVQNHALLLRCRDWRGELSESTDESLALRFFARDELPLDEMVPGERETLRKYFAWVETGEFQLD